MVGHEHMLDRHINQSVSGSNIGSREVRNMILILQIEKLSLRGCFLY